MIRRTAILATSTLVLTTLALSGCTTAGTGTGSPSSTPTGSTATSGTHTVTGADGKPVKLPTTINRVADAWPAHNEVVTMLGAGDKIVATVDKPDQLPWLYVVNPHLHQAPVVFTNSTVDVEALLAQHSDLVFQPQNEQITQALKGVNVPTLPLNFTDYGGLKQVVATTAQVLGGDAPSRGQQYNEYLDKNIKTVRDGTAKLSDAERPSVLHVTSLNPLTIDGTNTIIDTWIRDSGGKNAATVPGNNVKVGLEQIEAWNPDVVILGSNTLTDPQNPDAAATNLEKDPAWANINAVKNKKLYVNPVGAFYWDRYSAEGALQLLWVARLLHPDLFPNIDMVKETEAFYQKFLNYKLTDDQANKILTARKP